MSHPSFWGTWCFEVLDSRLNSCRGKEKVYLFDVVSKVTRFFLQQKQWHMRFFLWKEWVYGYSFSRILYKVVVSKKKGSPFIWGRFPFLTNMFQLGGDHQLIRWIFLRNVEVGVIDFKVATSSSSSALNVDVNYLILFTTDFKRMNVSNVQFYCWDGWQETTQLK